MDLVDHLDDEHGLGVFVGDDQHAVLGIGGVQSLDVRPHGAQIDDSVVDPDLAVGQDVNGDAAAPGLRRFRPARAVHHQPELLDEHGRDDEEDQQVQHEIEHRRQVDAVALLVAALCMAAKTHVSRS